MPNLIHSMTFNVCKDNGAAAAAFLKRVKAAGHYAELLEVHPAAVEHNASQGNSAPAAVAHDMNPDEALELATEIEGTFPQTERPAK